MIGAPSRLRLIRKAATLARIDETRDLSIEEKAARRKWKNAPMFDCADLDRRTRCIFLFNGQVLFSGGVLIAA